MTPWPGLEIAMGTALVATICLALIRPRLANWRLIDIPNHRSSHTEPTVRGGGLGIAAGILAGLALGALALAGTGAQIPYLALMAITVIALAVLGFTEDVHGLRITMRLISQALIISIVTAGFIVLAGLPVATFILAGLCGIFYVNAANFMDGVNGISSMHGAVVGGYFAIVGYVVKDPGLMLASIAIGMAFASFLPWNLARFPMFMGDTGSYVLGGCSWALSLWALNLGTSLVVVVAPLLVYAADVVFTLVRRSFRGVPLTQAHHDHAYQQVQEITNSHAWAAGVITSGTMTCAGLGIWGLFVPGSMLLVYAGNLAVVALVLLSPRFFVRRPNTPLRTGTVQ